MALIGLIFMIIGVLVASIYAWVKVINSMQRFNIEDFCFDEFDERSEGLLRKAGNLIPRLFFK